MFMQFYGDYVRAADSMAVNIALGKVGEARPEFLFADEVIKVNRRGREQARIIVLTRKAFYTFAPPLEKDVLKSQCDILQINSLSLRSEEHTSELQSLMRISYAVFCLKKNTKNCKHNNTSTQLRYELTY